MPESFDYRRHLSLAVRGFLVGTPAASARAKRIIAACPRTKPFTVNAMVWGSIPSALNDTVMHEDRAYLKALQRFLAGKSAIINRGYFSYDLRAAMTPPELACYTQLLEILTFLEGFPFADEERALAEYDRRCAEVAPMLATLSEQVSGLGQSGEETVYHLVLREVAVVALSINMRLSLHVAKHLTPAYEPVGAVGIHAFHRPPNLVDATSSVAWARKALQAIAGKEWLYLSWQLNEQGLQFSLH